MPTNIFHVSDLHFSAKEQVYLDSELLSGIEKIIKQVNDPNALMLITGDITFQGNKTGYNKAKKFFENLLN
jgi:predicted MPP superfamily phosphohydrolase